jgi:pSer/pThr/pTyr-binding forkhead associated (FHA) protein
VPRVLIQVTQGAAAPRRYKLDKAEILLGRSPHSDVVLDGEQVSRTHARIHWNQGRWWLDDCNSANGVFLDRGGRGAPFLARADVLVNGDLLYIGQYQLGFLLAGEETDLPDEPLPPPGEEFDRPCEKTVNIDRGALKEGLRAFMDSTPPPSAPFQGNGSGR